LSGKDQPVRVALFITRFNDTLFPNVGIATTRVLERLGHFVEVFGTAEAIVAPSASCVGMVRDLYPKAAALSGDKRLIESIELLVQRVYELSELLVKRLGVTDVGAYYPHRVIYHPTCHSLRVLHVGDAPLQLRGEVTRQASPLDPEAMAMRQLGRIFASPKRYEQAQRLARRGQRLFMHEGVIDHLPGMLAGWTTARDLAPMPRQSFRDWWRERQERQEGGQA
jgi:hypothetical protein